MMQQTLHEAVLERIYWDVRPQPGCIAGHVHRAELSYYRQYADDPGHRATLEIVEQDGRLVDVRFDEQMSPNYYMNRCQGRSKRYSDYGLFMLTRPKALDSGVVLHQGIQDYERQLLEAESSPRGWCKYLSVEAYAADASRCLSCSAFSLLACFSMA